MSTAGNRVGSIVYVVATSVEGTREALGAATAWARGLSGRVVLLVRQAQPDAHFTDRATEEVQAALRRVADLYTPRPDVLSCVCDRLIDLMQLVQPSGVVVIGGGTRWGWPTAEERLVRALTRAGYRVMFAHVPRGSSRLSTAAAAVRAHGGKARGKRAVGVR